MSNVSFDNTNDKKFRHVFYMYSTLTIEPKYYA